MRVAIAGAGAIGAYFGLCLARAGHDVVFMARGSHREAMRQNGITVTGVEPELHLDNPVLFDPRTPGKTAGLVLVCTKRPDTGTILTEAGPLIGKETVGLSLQNGIDAAEQITPFFSRGNVLAGATYIFVTIGKPGEIVMRAPLTRIQFGEPSGKPTQRTRDMLTVLSVPGIEAMLEQDMPTQLWRKFCFVTPHAGTGSYYRASVGEIRANPDALKLFEELVRETVAVGRIQGAKLSEGTEASMSALLDSVPPDGRASMLMDLLRAKPLELEYLTGAVVRLGKQVGVSTPASARVYQKLLPFVGGAR
ncbi:MAG: ketopantoate reductase family protein [Pseudomonadota bacterium]|nr:ketopantoate reductase family protein [Pseudomonadota bacterium]